MQHLDEEQVQRVLHREVPTALEASVREHLEACAECRDRVQAAERDEDTVHTLLRGLDHPVPRVDAAVIEALAGRRSPAPWGRWAAGILILVGGATIAYALPGSPLRDWLRGMAGSADPAAPESPVVPPQADTGGIAVVPGSRFVIQFTSSQSEGSARVWLRERDDVAVSGPSGAATFSAEAGRLVVDNAGSSATFDIEIPREAPRVEIRIGPRLVFLKEGPRVTPGPADPAGGSYVISLAPPRR